MNTTKANLLREKLQEAGLDLHGARLNFIARFIMALITVRTVSLATLASVLNAAVEVASNEKRIKRFFGAIVIEGDMLAKCVLAWLPQERYLLTLDRTNWKLGSIDINILMLGVAHEGMAYPLLWTILPHAGNSDTQERLALMDRVLTLLRPERIESLVENREFIGEDWYEGLEARGIAFIMRLKSNTLIGSRGRYQSANRRYGHLKHGEVYVCSKRCWVLGSRLFVAATRAPDGELVVVACTTQVQWALPRYARRWDIEMNHPHYPHKRLSAYSYCFLLAAFALLSRWATSLPFLKSIFEGSILPRNETPKTPGRVIAVQHEANSNHLLMTGLLTRQLALQAIFCANSSLPVVGDAAVGTRLLLHQPR